MRAVICGWSLMFVATAGCGEDPPIELRSELFREACAALVACGCEQPMYADEDHCRAVLAADLAGLETVARATGLRFEPECADVELPVVRLGCRGERELLFDPPACRRCAVVHGEEPLGAPCLDFGGYSDCAQGLECDPGTDVCVDPCALPADLPCAADNRRCAEGLICDTWESRACRPAPQAGEPCVSYQCAGDLDCYGIGENNVECGDLPDIGESCDEQCSDGICFDDPAGGLSCVVGPGEGEPCLHDYFCADGYDCDSPDHICHLVVEAELGESCSSDVPCALAWECIDDVCSRGTPYVCGGGTGDPP